MYVCVCQSAKRCWGVKVAESSTTFNKRKGYTQDMDHVHVGHCPHHIVLKPSFTNLGFFFLRACLYSLITAALSDLHHLPQLIPSGYFHRGSLRLWLSTLLMIDTCPWCQKLGPERPVVFCGSPKFEAHGCIGFYRFRKLDWFFFWMIGL